MAQPALPALPDLQDQPALRVLTEAMAQPAQPVLQDRMVHLVGLLSTTTNHLTLPILHPARATLDTTISQLKHLLQ